MTWAYINTMVQESLSVSQQLRQKRSGSRLVFEDVVIVTCMRSDAARHRIFGSSLLEGGLLKVEPLEVQDICPTFTLPGAHTKMSDYAFLRASRLFGASLDSATMHIRSNGFYSFLVLSLRAYRFFFHSFFRTRRLIAVRAAIYNSQRSRFYLYHPTALGGAIGSDSSGSAVQNVLRPTVLLFWGSCLVFGWWFCLALLSLVIFRLS